MKSARPLRLLSRRAAMIILGLLIVIFYHYKHARPITLQAYSTKSKASLLTSEGMLEEADRLSWLLNWAAAGPLYEHAEEKFHEKGDLRNELYARVGRLRSQFDQLSFEEISTGLNKILRN